MIVAVPGGVRIDVWVVPRARHAELAGVRNSAMLVRLTAAPVDGAANLQLIALLAEWLGVPRTHIAIEGGDRTRRKRVRVQGMTVADAHARLKV